MMGTTFHCPECGATLRCTHTDPTVGYEHNCPRCTAALRGHECAMPCDHDLIMALNYASGDVECRKCGALWVRSGLYLVETQQVLDAIVRALDVPRDRLGRLRGTYASDEPLHKFLLRYRDEEFIPDTASRDTVDQVRIVTGALREKRARAGRVHR